MSKGIIVALAVVGVILVTIFSIVGMFISCSNQEAILRTTIEAKLTDNTSEFDNMVKKISQVAQVSQKQMEMLKDIFVGYADARTPDSGGQLMTWIKESVPNVDMSTMNNLQNIIVGSRDSWTMRQKELVDLSREHTKLLRVFPSSFVLSILGRKEVPIVIVTSGRTEKAFATGKDDDTNVFSK
jgi:hypothetical protein